MRPAHWQHWVKNKAWVNTSRCISLLLHHCGDAPSTTSEMSSMTCLGTCSKRRSFVRHISYSPVSASNWREKRHRQHAVSKDRWMSTKDGIRLAIQSCWMYFMKVAGLTAGSEERLLDRNICSVKSRTPRHLVMRFWELWYSVTSLAVPTTYVQVGEVPSNPAVVHSLLPGTCSLTASSRGHALIRDSGCKLASKWLFSVRTTTSKRMLPFLVRMRPWQLDVRPGHTTQL